jgi:hypothetical protein
MSPRQLLMAHACSEYWTYNGVYILGIYLAQSRHNTCRLGVCFLLQSMISYTTQEE